MSLTAILAAFGPYVLAICALAGTIYTIRSQRPLRDADVAGKIASSTSLTIDNLLEEIARLNIKIESITLQLSDSKIVVKRHLELTTRLLHGIGLLLAQARMADIVPEWVPDLDVQKLLVLCATNSEDALSLAKDDVL